MRWVRLQRAEGGDDRGCDDGGAGEDAGVDGGTGDGGRGIDAVVAGKPLELELNKRGADASSSLLQRGQWNQLVEAVVMAPEALQQCCN